MSLSTSIIIAFFICLYVFGWVASYFETSVHQMPWGFKKIGSIILLFFIWWYIAFAMMRSGDL